LFSGPARKSARAPPLSPANRSTTLPFQPSTAAQHLQRRGPDALAAQRGPLNRARAHRWSLTRGPRTSSPSSSRVRHGLRPRRHRFLLGPAYLARPASRGAPRRPIKPLPHP
jgi:hypothetical protein